ncbi:MAG: hypothetical protein J6X66_09015 [Lachnospiraceae bacterium]|nr:hypothetical protein [Lachnospiraceae bacterium]
MCNDRIKLIYVLVSAIFLTACGKQYDTPESGLGNLDISKDGKVEAVLIDDFSKDYYEENELKAYIDSELSAYNSSHGADSVKFVSSELSGGIMKVMLSFASIGDYDEFMPDLLFTGTVQEAYDRGYDIDQALTMADDPEHIIGKSDLMKMADQSIMVFSGKKSIKVPGRIKYYTQSMRLTGEDTVEASEDGTYIIIY